MSKAKEPAPRVRCAIYSRKSTEEGLDQEFNSIDHQREAGEAYVASQAGEGWVCLPDRYEDGGYTGGNMDRPALKRLLTDIEAGGVDCVVVYKVDRLSRSLLDFARMMEVFEKRRVTFVSVTQQIHTGHSMGRLMLNVLLSFAQFEREIIAERTRDKIAAARRKGKWSGGQPLLGYDVDPNGSKLVVNAAEAARVRAIFELYLQHQALMPVLHELSRRKWTTKQWMTRAGRQRGGRAFTKAGLHKLLTNVTYAGKVRYKSEVHPGEHAGIVEPGVWQKLQVLLQRNGRTGGAMVRNKHGALLKGLLHCGGCGCAMTPSHSKRGGKLYRYYVCTNAQRRGWGACATKSAPAGAIERVVVEQLRRAGRDPALVAATARQAARQVDERLAQIDDERRGLQRDTARWAGEIDKLAAASSAESAAARMADLQERIRVAERRASELMVEADELARGRVTTDEVEQALAAFEPVWESMAPAEQANLLSLLVERVDFDGAAGKLAVHFHAAGIRSLTNEAGRGDAA
jgi:site-specific DNA recombinase